MQKIRPTVLAACLAAFACGDSKQDFALPQMMPAQSPPMAASTAVSRKAASCDGARRGSPCGEAASQKHCIDAQCVKNACGDTVTAGGEECDDGNQRDADGCDSRCRIEPAPGCGNGEPDPGEECDDGNASDADACTHLCMTPNCGEQCDHGNLAGAGGADVDSAGASAGPASGVRGMPDAGSVTAGTSGAASGNVAHWETCTACRQARCTNYLGTGLDVFGGCFLTVDPILGADPSDPNFIQDCVDVVDCAFQNDCAYGDAEQPPAFGCYCGSSTAEQCFRDGPAANAPCVAQIHKAARSTLSSEILRPAEDQDSVTRIIDFMYPLGWANFLLECDRDLCSTGAGKCTP